MISQAMPGPTLRVHVAEGIGIQSSGSLLGGNNLFVAVKLDGTSCGKSAAFKESGGRLSWDLHIVVQCQPSSRNLEFEVKRSGMMGSHYIGGCVVEVSPHAVLEQQVLPIWDSSRREVGRIQVSIIPDGLASAPPSAPGGLVNRAGSFAIGASESFANPGAGLQSQGTASFGTSSFGLTNHAGGSASSSAPRPTLSTQRSSLTVHSEHQGGGLANYARSSSMMSQQEQIPGCIGAAPSFARSGTAGLANLAEARDDGSRPNALPRAQEIIQEMAEISPGSQEYLQKLSQALDNLRHAAQEDLKRDEGRAALDACKQHIQGVFDDAMTKKSARDENPAFWLAGRLPELEETEVTLQDQLLSKWHQHKMVQALQSVKDLMPTSGNMQHWLEQTGFQDFMDAVDLAEFHAQRAQQDVTRAVSNLLEQLRPDLAPAAQNLLRQGQLDKVENILAMLGVSRVEVLGLVTIQQDLQRLKGLDLLRAALVPASGQIGFPELKNRQLRFANMTLRTALADDPSGLAASAVTSLLLQELLPTCMQHSSDSAQAAICTAAELRVPVDELWKTVHRIYNDLPGDRKTMSAMLLRVSSEQGLASPAWLLTPDQAACQHLIRSALRARDASGLQTACQQVMDTAGGKEACQEEMREALTCLRAEFRLPVAWDVESMFTGTKLLAKTEIKDLNLLRLFDKLLKQTAQPDVRTRDRRGVMPKNFTAVKAVQVMNAASWATYMQRREVMRQECEHLKSRFDRDHWQDNLNGELMTMTSLGDKTSLLNSDTPLMPEVNECWLLHGTSHAAAEGITTEDFDMTRANPLGLFGAGVYFGESSSKADEYAGGKMIDGQELFPLLICRVCLGYVYYCDERRPDRRMLESRCLREQWHSVIGDRKKTSGTFREFIIYDNLQAVPAYIVYYSRQF